jgi:hypothetical protein
MSTKGSFIIRKNNTDKDLFIPADANPEISGRDAVNHNTLNLREAMQ